MPNSEIAADHLPPSWGDLALKLGAGKSNLLDVIELAPLSSVDSALAGRCPPPEIPCLRVPPAHLPAGGAHHRRFGVLVLFPWASPHGRSSLFMHLALMTLRLPSLSPLVRCISSPHFCRFSAAPPSRPDAANRSVSQCHSRNYHFVARLASPSRILTPAFGLPFQLGTRLGIDLAAWSLRQISIADADH